MEGERRSSSLRRKRKPLSDTTNTISTNRRSFPSSENKSSALIKPLKPSNSSTTTTTTTNNNNPKPPSSDSFKTRTSTGSNNSPAPPSTLSDSGGRDHREFRPLVSQNQPKDAKTRKDKGKMVLESHNIKASEPLTPHVLEMSSSSASGIHDQERQDFLTVYHQRRAPQKRKPVEGKIILPFSYFADKRIKKIGVEHDGDGDNSQSGSLTNPLPIHNNKKGCRKRHDGSIMHGMTQDEVEKLRAYYADVDAFELREEVISETGSYLD